MNKFAVIVPVYNAEKYICKCLDSIIQQDYSDFKDFKVCVIDDCSTDGTWEHILEYPFKRLRNEQRVASGIANIKKGIDFLNLSDDTIIVLVDGDDYLASNNVLSYLNEIYTKDIWLTYGDFAPVSGKYKNICKPIDNTQEYRKSGKWLSSHLRTFRKWLWDKIDDKDLRDENGEYFHMAWDLAMMYPMIEMAGSHVKFIDKVLYMYNDLESE